MARGLTFLCFWSPKLNASKVDWLVSESFRIVALTEPGRVLAERLLLSFPDAELWYKPKPFADTVQAAFCRGERLLMICATGIAIRVLAPVLVNKSIDPPVVVLDEYGQFAIPLLSGHEGGANDWARDIAQSLSAKLVVTTSNYYLKPVYTVGMGCDRGCPQEDLRALLFKGLQGSGLVLEQVSSISSIDIKADEEGLISLAKSLGKSFHTYNKSELAPMEPLLSVKSNYIFDTVGVYGVAESAALLAAQNETGQSSELVLNKIKSRRSTCAIARSYPKNDQELL